MGVATGLVGGSCLVWGQVAVGQPTFDSCPSYYRCRRRCSWSPRTAPGFGPDRLAQGRGRPAGPGRRPVRACRSSCSSTRWTRSSAPIKEFLETGQKGLRVGRLLVACVDEYSENENLRKTTNPGDWARISGKRASASSASAPWRRAPRRLVDRQRGQHGPVPVTWGSRLATRRRSGRAGPGGTSRRRTRSDRFRVSQSAWMPGLARSAHEQDG
jgi:hypothetical protein